MAADLSVIKTASPNPVGVGGQLTYTLEVRNNSLTEFATGVTLTDNIPAGVLLSSIDVETANYCYENGLITWNIGTMMPGEHTTMTVVVIPQSAGTLINEALVTQDVADPDTNNNRGRAEVTVEPASDLIICKESCPTEATVGGTLSYIISVLNNGPSPATNVTVTDTLPGNITGISATPSQGSCDTSVNPIICNLGNLNVGERASITLSMSPTIEGVFKNQATVKADQPDPNSTNNSTDTSAIVNPAADLSITKTASPEEVVLNNTLTYHILVTNHGPSKATDVKVLDNLPAGIDLNNVSVVPSQGSCSRAGSLITCELGELEKAAEATVTIGVKPNELGLINNAASVSAFETDPKPCNNSDSACAYVRLVESTDISVTQTHSPEPATLCTPVTYQVTVTNHGQISATGVILVDQLPPSLEILSVCASQGRYAICSDSGCQPGTHRSLCEKHKDPCHSCDSECQTSNEIVWQLGALAPGATATLAVCTKPKLLGTIHTTAIVTGNEEDLDPDNNEDTDTLTVVTLVEQIDYLANQINVLVILGILEEQYANALQADLLEVKRLMTSGETHEAERAIKSLIKKIDKYMSQGVLPVAQGNSLLETAELIKRQLGSHCADGDCHRSTSQGDDACD